jgi:hypothetical protein
MTRLNSGSPKENRQQAALLLGLAKEGRDDFRRILLSEGMARQGGANAQNCQTHEKFPVRKPCRALS